MWNHPCVNVWKETVLHRTVPRQRVNGNPNRTSTEWFHIEPFQSPRVNAALVRIDVARLDLELPAPLYFSVILETGISQIFLGRLLL